MARHFISIETSLIAFDEHGHVAATITDHDGMTPLHVLSINPDADGGAIMACFCANMGALFVGDNRDKTPLDYLVVHHDLEIHLSLVAALCTHRDNRSSHRLTLDPRLL